MPSLFRLLFVLAIIGGIGGAVIVALATLVEPNTREITVTIPPDQFVKPH